MNFLEANRKQACHDRYVAFVSSTNQLKIFTRSHRAAPRITCDSKFQVIMYNASQIVRRITFRKAPVLPPRQPCVVLRPVVVLPQQLCASIHVTPSLATRQPPRRTQTACRIDTKYVCPPPPRKPPKKRRWWLWLLASMLMGMFIVANLAPDKMCEWKCRESLIYNILAPLVMLREPDEETDEECQPLAQRQPVCKDKKCTEAAKNTKH